MRWTTVVWMGVLGACSGPDGVDSDVDTDTDPPTEELPATPPPTEETRQRLPTSFVLRLQKRRTWQLWNYQWMVTGSPALIPSISLRLMPTISISTKPLLPSEATIVAGGWSWLGG